ncbi:hypothetical protein B9Q02_02840 [Candidatus Marsarchaeota G1 archaeon BE_D]|jgi:hypothetical protein|uniref:Uncharacterized protein n=2 Tax=Candidatus Marsarchaeota TaxID=1978152 RepID=A0A2R6AIZ5_9ARCH|nr:MAG: hypothetical protein B9Q02_02840 [Candidatus Marsarchaeota G1 archaeon BE_D]PSO03612.1 MAG: hypothetical protein B9Q10_00395 [Candidatus Marsarchaeota G2 archaeon ECH_B_SAG-E12]
MLHLKKISSNVFLALFVFCFFGYGFVSKRVFDYLAYISAVCLILSSIERNFTETLRKVGIALIEIGLLSLVFSIIGWNALGLYSQTYFWIALLGFVIVVSLPLLTKRNQALPLG